ncbi:MAG: CHASE2 domain-containing protein, partial [Myxococcales bacterium]
MAFSTSARKLRTGLSVGILIGGLAVIAVNNRPTPHTPSDAAGGVSALLERLELTFYDMVSRREAGERPASSDIVLVTIDDTSLDYARDTLNYSWPWPRTAMGRIVQELRALGAKLVVLDLIFPDESCREEDTPEEFARMLEEAGNTVLAFNFVKQQFFARNPGEGRWAIQQGSYASRTEAVLAARGLLGMQIPKPYVVTREGRYELWLGWYSNRALATEDIKVRRAVLKLDPKGQPPVQHIPVELAPEEVTLQHVFAERNTVRVSGSTGINTKDGDILLPVAGLAASEVRFGAVDARPDTDGVWRTAEYLHKYEGRYYPSLAMAAAMLLAGTDEVTARDHRLHLGPYSVPLDENGRTTLRFYGIPDPVTNSPYTTLPISAVIAEVGRREVGRRQDARLRELLDGKIVFVSNEASSLVDVKPTPVSDRSSGTLGQ